ncbi:MAG TPA: winged helix-turn-helix transcriptional regulator [Solirubrobacterales bacterium]|nr:winged helix-turn-helix transcriptional regulator [Solirubrobacterales bacterium]
MTKRSYGEACRFAHALDLVGERWALLVVRELLLGPKRFTDLRAGLPHASSNILSERLRDLEQGAVIQRRKLPPPAASIVYELTEWGRELEPIVTKLGAWGARSPFPPDSQEIGPDSIVLALRSLFDAAAAGDLEATYGLQIDEQRFRVEIADGGLALNRGAASDPEASIAIPDAPTLAAVLTGELPLDDALDSGAARIEGSKQAAKRFLRLFPMPEPCECAGSPAPTEAVAGGSHGA